MNNPKIRKISFEKSTVIILYYQYRKLLVPFVAIATSILVFYFIVYPQFSDIGNLQQKLADLRTKDQVIKTNLTKLSAVNEGQLDSQLQTLSQALPPEKNFTGILYALSTAASDANVQLSDFGFSVGDISTHSAQLSGQLSIQMAFSVKGPVQNAQKFVSDLSQKLPLSEITTVANNGNTTQFNASFFYRPYAPVNYTVDGTVPDVPAGVAGLVKKVALWQISSQNEQTTQVFGGGTSSSAATLSPTTTP